jgi:hypothetical protein
LLQKQQEKNILQLFSEFQSPIFLTDLQEKLQFKHGFRQEHRGRLSPYHPKVEGSSLATAVVIEKEKISSKKLY